VQLFYLQQQGGLLAFKPAKFTQANVFCPLDFLGLFNPCPLQPGLTTDFGGDFPIFIFYDCTSSSVIGFYTATTLTTQGTDVYIT